jgi:ABC-2 type transport system ATP-binding protein
MNAKPHPPGTADTPVIRARGLRKQYGRKVAVRDIDFDIPRGRIVGLVGPNGAGKTSALKAILGLAGFRGDLEVLGHHPLHERDRLMQDIAFIADVATLPKWIRVRELVRLMEAVHPRFSVSECQQYLAETRIKPTDKVKSLSKGMVVQLHLALVMAIDARLLVLDEPTLGLDIMFRKRFYQHLLEEYFDGERTIIITTHQIEEVEHILSDLMFIRDGEIVLHSDMDSIQQRYTEVMVGDEHLAEARALGPLHERRVFGRHVLLFEDIERERLRALGELHAPSVADLFVAVMSRGNDGTPAGATS